jgi:hypothetical protein
MIRRGFWLAVGAAGGIMAYRRVARLAERSWARETIRFTRDVREGMGVYSARHPAGGGPTLGAAGNDERTDEKTKDDR